MKWLQTLSTQTIILLLTFLLTLPAIGIIIHAGLQDRDNALDESHRDSALLVNNIASELLSKVEASHQMMEMLSLLPEVRERNSELLNQLLADLNQKYPLYGNIIFVDRTGTSWANTSPTGKQVNLADRKAFKDAMATGKFSPGEYAVGRVSGKPLLNFAYPLTDDTGRPDGAILFAMQLEYLDKLFKVGTLPPGTSFGLFDHSGVFIYRTLDREKYIGKKDRQHNFDLMKNGPDEGHFAALSNDGVKRSAVYRKIRLSADHPPFAYIRGGIPVEALLKKANATMYRNMSGMAVSLVLTVGLVLYINKRIIVNRLILLQNASMHIASGDLHIRVADEVRGGELGGLGLAFDEMAKRLAERELALKKSESEYRFLAESSADIIWQLGADRTISFVNSADERLRGYSKFEVLGKSLTDFMTPDDVVRLDEINRSRQTNEQQGIITGLLRFETSLLCKNGSAICVEVLSSPIRDENGDIVAYHGVARDITERKKSDEEREKLILQLQNALAEIKVLSGILPICSYCKKIRNDEGYWNQLESYLSKHSDILFSHGICPDCVKTAYKEIEEMREIR